MRIIISNQKEADLLNVISKIWPLGVDIEVSSEGSGEYYLDKDLLENGSVHFPSGAAIVTDMKMVEVEKP